VVGESDTPSAGILEQSVEARNRVGIGLSDWPASLHSLHVHKWLLLVYSCWMMFKNHM
jgi:hypothetical protein